MQLSSDFLKAELSYKFTAQFPKVLVDPYCKWDKHYRAGRVIKMRATFPGHK